MASTNLPNPKIDGDEGKKPKLSSRNKVGLMGRLAVAGALAGPGVLLPAAATIAGITASKDVHAQQSDDEDNPFAGIVMPTAAPTKPSAPTRPSRPSAPAKPSMDEEAITKLIAEQIAKQKETVITEARADAFREAQLWAFISSLSSAILGGLLAYKAAKRQQDNRAEETEESAAGAIEQVRALEAYIRQGIPDPAKANEIMTLLSSPQSKQALEDMITYAIQMRSGTTTPPSTTTP